MSNIDLGRQLKSLAKPAGNFVKVNIANVYDTLETLSTFFYSKKHEWVAICFLDEQHACKLIWFNKGPNHRTVPLKLSPQQAFEVGGQIGTKSIIVAHNHPMSSQDIPDYGMRSLNIQASYEHKVQILDFSDADLSLRTNWRGFLETKGLSHADAVFVAGTYTINGHEHIIYNYNLCKPKATHNTKATYNNKKCFIATTVFGEDAHETELLRKFRDLVLLRSRIGRTACRLYYRISPAVAKSLERHPRLKVLVAALLLRLIARIDQFLAGTKPKEVPNNGFHADADKAPRR